MTTRRINHLSWGRAGGIRAVSLLTVLSVVFCLCHVLSAADAVGTNSPSSTPVPAPVTTLLEYQETSYTLNNLHVSLTDLSAPFPKEPAAAPGKVVRGTLNFLSDANNSISFLWQRDAGKLYLDLNRNQDLTDDTEGVYSITNSKPIYYQTFKNVRIPLATPLGTCKVLADLNIYDYGSRPNCNLAVRSFWQGKVTLQGKDWQVGIVPNDLTRNVSLENVQMVFRSWDKRSRPFNANNGTLDSFPFARKLFIDGHGYQLGWLKGTPNGELKPTLQMTEQTVPQGELQITGKYIERVVLACETYTVVLDRPTNTVKVPVGNYNTRNILLEQGGIAAYSATTMGQTTSPTIAVNIKAPTMMAIGGPLTNSVVVTHQGGDLRMDYSLIGAGGMTYQLAVQNRSKPPEFVIYKGDKSIATGTFEYG